MVYNNNQLNIVNSCSPWSTVGNPDILFPLDKFECLLQGIGWNDSSKWVDHWKQYGAPDIALSYWAPGTKSDWFWGLGLPLLSEIERLISLDLSTSIIGITALPGSGKTSLGNWLEAASNSMGWPVTVLSLDDFYLPGEELDQAMLGNPWKVPRGIPGSHSIEVMYKQILKWKNNGYLFTPTFDKSLRNGFGDRSEWRISKPRVLILEGWFLCCEPTDLPLDSINQSSDLITPLSIEELNYQEKIQVSLSEYSCIWELVERLWHLKPITFSATNKWKKEQEDNMYKIRGSSLRGDKLKSFIRMINSAIPQKSLLEINSDVVAEINQKRQICWLGNKEDQPK